MALQPLQLCKQMSDSNLFMRICLLVTVPCREVCPVNHKNAVSFVAVRSIGKVRLHVNRQLVGAKDFAVFNAVVWSSPSSVYDCCYVSQTHKAEWLIPLVINVWVAGKTV